MINLYRKYSLEQTDGVIILPNGDAIRTIELPRKDNKVNVSCILEGQYKVKRDHTGKHQYFKVCDVPGRTHIEIHLGSKPSHLQGCIGIYRKRDIEKLIEFFGENDWILNIKEDEEHYNIFIGNKLARNKRWSD